MIVATIVNNNGFVSWDFVKCLVGLQGHYEVTCAEGPDVWANRNKIFNYAKERNQSLLSVDSDMVFTLEQVKRMEQHLDKYDVVSGLYVLGRPPYPPAVWKRIEGDYELTDVPNEFSEVGAVAGGFLGISAKVIQALDNPFVFVNEGEIQHDADTSFCHRAREAGFKIWIDPKISLGHIRTDFKTYENTR